MKNKLTFLQHCTLTSINNKKRKYYAWQYKPVIGGTANKKI